MAKTNIGRKLYVCATAQPTDLDLAGYAGLTWVQVKHVGSITGMGTKENIVNYDELETDVIQKSKGLTNAGDPVIEWARTPADPGQIICKTIAGTKLDYAFKIEDADAESGFTNTIYYNRGKVTGPERQGGRAEDFNTETYNLGLNQREIVVDPAAQSIPVNTIPPSVAGLADASSGILYGGVGTWTNTSGSDVTYPMKWQQDTGGNGTFVDIGGATASTYDPAVGTIGNAIRFGVRATNSAGPAAAYVYSFPTPLVVA